MKRIVMLALLVVVMSLVSGCVMFPKRIQSTYNYKLPRIPITATTKSIGTKEGYPTWCQNIAQAGLQFNEISKRFEQNWVNILRTTVDMPDRPSKITMISPFKYEEKNFNLSYESINEGDYDTKVIVKFPEQLNRIVMVFKCSTNPGLWEFTVAIDQDRIWRFEYDSTAGDRYVRFIGYGRYNNGTTSGYNSYSMEISEDDTTVKFCNDVYKVLYNKTKPEIPTTAINTYSLECGALLNKNEVVFVGSFDNPLDDETISSQYPDYPTVFQTLQISHRRAPLSTIKFNSNLELIEGA